MGQTVIFCVLVGGVLGVVVFFAGRALLLSYVRSWLGADGDA